MRKFAISGTLLLVSTSAFADDTAKVSVAPWVDILKPYVDLLVQGVVIPVVVALVLALVSKWTGVKISQTNSERLKSAAATEAGAAMAKAEDNLRGASITIDSPMVRNAVTAIQQRVPDLINATGVTPEVLGKFVQGEIGKLQAQASGGSTITAPAAENQTINVTNEAAHQ